MADGIPELLQAVGMANEKFKDRSQSVGELTERQNEAARQEDDSLIQAANNNKVIASAKLVADKQAETQVNDFANKLGSNPDASGEIMTKLAEDWKSASLRAIDKQNKLESDLSINFFQHPGAFIKAQIRMEQTVKEADAAAHHRDSSFNALNQAQGLTQGAVAQTNALKKTVTDATMQATLDNIDADLQGKRAALTIQNAGIQMDGLKTLNSMDIATINNLQAGVSAQQAAQQMKIQQAHLKMAESQYQQGLIEFKAKMDEKAATKEDMEFFAGTVKKGASAMGVDLSGLGTTKIVNLLNSKAEGFADYFNAGVRVQTSGTPMISDNAGEAARIVAERNAPLRPEQSSIKKLLASTWARATSPQGAADGRYDINKREQVVGGAAQFAIEAANKMQAKIDPVDGTNIYAAPPLEAVTQVPGLQNTAWYKTVMEPQMKAGGLKEFDSAQLVALTAAAVKAKKITFDDAATGLQGAHNAAIKLNNVTKNYKGLGLPEQKSFKIELPNAYGIIRHFDMSTPQSVQQILSNKLREDQVYKVDSTNPFRY